MGRVKLDLSEIDLDKIGEIFLDFIKNNRESGLEVELHVGQDAEKIKIVVGILENLNIYFSLGGLFMGDIKRITIFPR